MNRKFYVTAAIPYVNSFPHVGHALEFVQTDTIGRYHRLLGEDVLVLSGGDENALKNVQAAEQAGVPIQEFVDTNTEIFFNLTRGLNTQFDVWQKGSDKEHHFPSSQKLWSLCEQAGDIYKKAYEGLYCIGCEAFYLPEELNEQGECFEHPGKSLQSVSEENHFFRLSKYQDKLINLIETDEVRIVPESRRNEALSFLKSGLEDISISRSNERAKNWGVPVPGDPTQRQFVWFDALNIYQSGVGFGWNEEMYEKWWPADLHVIGKGILRFHAIYFVAFLLSAGLRLPKEIFVHGYFTIDGQKMSKTLGNVIDPFDLINKYGADALRYYLLARFSPFEDGDFSEEKFKEVYNADLANNLGNLVARVAKLSENVRLSVPKTTQDSFDDEVTKHLESYQFNLALQTIWSWIDNLNKKIDTEKLWEDTSGKKEILQEIVLEIQKIAFNLRPFLPETAKRIEKQFSGEIHPSESLFPRL
ncbi:MAG: methionine--tRNA ligase [Candidatus Blackburnbacteria bacterium]|nr:methionine--tRNA ligase [Candidatus Blackburnbacteria bacterium]